MSKAKLARIVAKIDALVEEMAAIVGGRDDWASERKEGWEESEKGVAYLEMTESLREVLEGLESAQGAMPEGAGVK